MKELSDAHLWEIRQVRDIAALAVAVAAVWLLFRLREVLMPAFTGLLLAYIFEPLVSAAHERGRLPRILATSILLVGLITVGVLFGLWFLPLVINQGYALFYNLRQYLGDILQQSAVRFGVPQEEVVRMLQPEPTALLKFVGGVIGTASSTILWVFLLPFFLFAFSWKFPMVSKGAKACVPRRRRREVIGVIRSIDREWGDFFRARLIIGLISGFILAFGWLAAGVPYWFLLGMLGGMLGIVPYLSSVAWIAAMLFKYLSADGLSWFSVLLLPSLIFWGVHLLEEMVLIPRIQKHPLNLGPSAVILVILIGGAAAGIWGVLLAIPVASALKIIFQKFLEKSPQESIP